jgi:hypothetical protein
MTWRAFVRLHRQSLLAVDFFTVETLWFQRLYVLFFIELSSRRVHVVGCTPTPSAQWVSQQARQLTWSLTERPELSTSSPCSRTITMASVFTERWASLRLTRHDRRSRWRLSGARLVSSVAIVSVVSFTSTAWRREGFLHLTGSPTVST